MSKRLIDADALMETIRAHDYPLRDYFNSTDRGMYTLGIKQAVDEQPTIDAAEVVHGEWVGVHEYIDHLEKVTGEKFQISNLYDGCNFCNNCWYSFPRKYNYCPNCGAKMDGEVKHE